MTIAKGADESPERIGLALGERVDAIAAWRYFDTFRSTACLLAVEFVAATNDTP